MTAARVPDWRPRLTAYLASIAATPFAYGTHDCALFVAGTIKAMTDGDLAAGLAPYTTLKRGLKALSAAGYRSPEHLLQVHFDQVPPALAQVGDIAILPPQDGVPAMGIVVGEMIACLRLDGIGHVSRMAAVAAYRVP